MAENVVSKVDKKWVDGIRIAVQEKRLQVTQWEDGFVDSVERILDGGKELSVKQRRILDGIHERIRPW